jgi:hypothetical protein
METKENWAQKRTADDKKLSKDDISIYWIHCNQNSLHPVPPHCPSTLSLHTVMPLKHPGVFHLAFEGRILLTGSEQGAIERLICPVLNQKQRGLHRCFYSRKMNEQQTARYATKIYYDWLKILQTKRRVKRTAQGLSLQKQ